MIKINPKIICFIIFALIIVISLITNPLKANAIESNSKQAISALNTIMGIRTDSYNITQNIQEGNLYGSPREDINSIFKSTQGSFNVKCTFMKGFLSQIYFSDINGTILTSQSDYLEISKEILNNFKEFSGDSNYDQFAVMLNGVESGKNVSLTLKNVYLKITNFANASTYVWTYVDSNGIKAEQKNIELSFENGQLIGFINNWPLYKVVGTPKLSVDQATELAIEASETFSYEVTVDNKTVEKVTGFTIDPKSLGHSTLAYSNFYEPSYARDSDPFTLYPLWYVPLGFEKFYPGDVSGMAVAIWADTGKIGGMQEIIVDSNLGNYAPFTSSEFNIQNNALNQISVFSIPFLLFFICMVLVYIISYKKPKRAVCLSRKFITLFFSGLILLSLSTIVTPQVSATVGKSRIYSCENTPDGYYNSTADIAEANATAEICNYVGNLTQNNGYSTSNLHGTGTTVSSVVDNIYGDEQGYDHTILLHVGHFNYKGRSYQADNGDAIWDTSIISHTSSGKHSFAFIWVCTTASNPNVNGQVQWIDYQSNPPSQPGMPIAWTHRDGTTGHPLMNFDGFSNPDGSGQCYISFYGFSPMVSGLPLHTFEGNTPTNCKEFLKDFYYHAICDGLSVHDALDQASYHYFGYYYLNTPLYQGYQSYWPGNNIPPMDHSGYYPIDFPEMWDDPYSPNYMRVHGDSNMHIYNPSLAISSSSGGSTNLDGVHQYTYGTTATVTASPNSGKVLYNWMLDGTQNLGNALSIDVTMNSNHTLYANFTNAPSYAYAYSITANDYAVQPIKLTGFQPDGYGATIQCYGPYGIHGSITATLNSAASGHVGIYCAGDGSLLVEVSSNGANWVSLGSHTLTSTPQWVEYGIYSSSFSYIRFTADGAAIYNVGVDSVRVIPLQYYTLTIYSGSGGYTSPSSGAYQYVEGSTAYVTAYANTGYSFSYWLLDGQNAGSSNPIGVSIYSGHSLQPVFTPVTYYLSVSSTSGGYTSPSSGTYGYTYGQTATVTANANAGYYFDHWHLDDVDAGSSNPIYVTMYDGHTLQAIFTAIPTYSLTVSAVNNYGMACSPQVYIDGNYVGNAPVTVYVAAGSHTVWAETFWVYWYLYGFSDGLGNGASRTITSNTNIVAYYGP